MDPHAESLAVLIPTRNRPHDLTLAVGTVLQQTVLPQELIIVDQSPDDSSERGVRELFAASPKATQMTLRYLRDPSISSLAIARNIALEMNRSELFLFLDDDVELEADFVERLLEAYAADSTVTGISGIITNYCPLPPLARLWERIFVCGPFRDDRQSIYSRADQLRGRSPIPVSRFGGGLMSFRTALTGGARFDENLKGASEGEDVDFCLHMPPGARLEMDPRVRLVHNSSPVGRQPEHWIAAVVRGNVYLYYRNWRKHLPNRVAFGWLLAGYALLALMHTAKQRSTQPWRSFTSALRAGRSRGLGLA